MDDLTIQAGVRTGGGAEPQVGQGMPANPTGDVLEALSGFSKLAGHLLAPVIEREKTAAMVQGAAEVMQGRTTAQVAAENPAWARTFGDSYAVQGAALQEAASHGTRFLTRVQQAMPELRKLSQESFSRHVAAQLEVDLPTDPQAAILAKQRVMQSLPEVTNLWSRSHLQWQQEDALVKHTTAVQSAVELFKTGEEARRLNPGVMDPTLDDAAWGQFMSAMVAPPGVDPKAHEQVMHRSIVGSLGTPGGVALYKALQDRGMWATLPQEVQERGRTQARQQALEAVRRDPLQLELGAEVAEFRASAYRHSVPDLLAKAYELNQKAETVLGIPQDLWQQVSTTEMETTLRGREAKILSIQDAAERKRAADLEWERRKALSKHEAAVRRAERAAEKARDKAEKHADMMAGLEQAYASSQPGAFGAALQAQGIPAPVRREINARALQRYDVAGLDPSSPEYGQRVVGMATFLTKLVGPGGMAPPPEIDNLTKGALAGAEYGPAVEYAVNLGLAVKDPATRAALFTGPQARAIDTFRGLVLQNTTQKPGEAPVFKGDKQALWMQAQAMAARPPAPQGGEDGKAIGEELRKLAGFTDSPILDGLLQREYAERHELPEDARRTAALAAVRGKAYSAGGITVLTAPGIGNIGEGFTVHGGMPADKQGYAMKPLLRDWGKRFNATAPPLVYRAPDKQGVAQFVAVFETPTGTREQRFTGHELRVQFNTMTAPPKADPNAPAYVAP